MQQARVNRCLRPGYGAASREPVSRRCCRPSEAAVSSATHSSNFSAYGKGDVRSSAAASSSPSSDGRGCAGVATRAGSTLAAGPSAPALPRCSPPPSAADSLPVLPTLARRDDDVCDRLEVTWLADELRDRERGSRSVVSYERHGAASRLAVELERAVRPMLGAWDGADCVGHDAAIPGGSVAQSSQRHIDIMS